MKILNAFSLAMLRHNTEDPCYTRFTPIGLEEAVRLARANTGSGAITGMGCNFSTLDSYVGHADTAAMFAAILGVPVACRRESCMLGSRPDPEIALIGQYSGPRLPEGATALPEGAKIEWWTVEVGFRG